MPFLVLRILLATLATVLVHATAGFAESHGGISLVDTARQVGINLENVSGGKKKDYIVEFNGNGGAFFDYDNDGDMDVLIVNGSTLERLKEGGDVMAALYRNDGTFIDVTVESGLTTRGWGMGVCVADYNNDGNEDVYITAFGPNVLYRNNGDGTFADVTAQAGIGDLRWSTNCAFGDYDRDGDVDLYVANYLTFDETKVQRRGCKRKGMVVPCGPLGLPGEPDALYRNNGDGTFADVTERAAIKDPGHYGFGVIFGDLDNDGWADIYVANDSVPNDLYLNNGDGTFSEVGLRHGAALNDAGRPQAGMGVDFGDFNNDGYFDIFVTNFSNDTNTLYQNDESGVLTDVTIPAGLGESSYPYLGWGTGFVDLDNDGLLDIFIANGHVYPDVDDAKIGTTFLQSNQVYRYLGKGRYREVTKEVGGGVLIEKSSRGAAFGDYDNDGDVDVLVINLDDRPTLLRNDTQNSHHWLTLRLVGVKSNRSAIGARIEVTEGGRRQIAEVRSGGSYLSHNDSRVHFGMGAATEVERLEVRWPSGLIETFRDVQVDRILVVIEGQGITLRNAR